jgi:hypothetical protein
MANAMNYTRARTRAPTHAPTHIHIYIYTHTHTQRPLQQELQFKPTFISVSYNCFIFYCASINTKGMLLFHAELAH